MRNLNLFTKKELEQFNQKSPIFTPEQMKIINKKTPDSEIEIEKEKDGSTYKTVKASYVKYLVMMVTGGDYTFEIKNKEFINRNKEILVECRLSLPNKNGVPIFRDQFGQSNISNYSKVGDSFKSAATNAFKKCASEFGFCWDIFGQESIQPKEETLPEISHAEKKVLDRLEHFFKEASNVEELETYYETFLEKSKETAHTKELFKKYMNLILN